jgi:hypothetical protein
VIRNGDSLHTAAAVQIEQGRPKPLKVVNVEPKWFGPLFDNQEHETARQDLLSGRLLRSGSRLLPRSRRAHRTRLGGWWGSSPASLVLPLKNPLQND